MELGTRDTKWKIFVAAVDLFCKNGYDKVSMRDIAATVKIKASSIYYHFASKDELLSQIYEFYETNYDISLPNLDDLITMIPEMPPHEVLAKLIVSFDRKISRLMFEIMHIMVDRSKFDKQAKRLANKAFVDVPRQYVGSVLSKMMELDMIEPIDIDAFLTLHSSLDFYALYLHGSKLAIPFKEYARGRVLLYDMIRPKAR